MKKPLAAVARALDRSRMGRIASELLEELFKIPLLGCRRCGDCGIQHVAFLCPESQCPKHTRNGPCGGSHQGRCEVRPERWCVWVRAYRRLAAADRTTELVQACVPPRMWELDRSSSWLNFHLGRDHQSVSTDIVRFCSTTTCRFEPDPTAPESASR